ncbi:MAG TPA: hypothetical protein VIL46_14760, partial [Gemmataceae bacterium]
MTPRRLIPRCLSPALLLGGLLAGAPAAQAQTSRLQFSSDPAKLVNPRPDLFVRPNTAETVYLFVRNDADDPRQLTVRLESLDGSTPPVQASLEVPRGQYARVRLPKL